LIGALRPLGSAHLNLVNAAVSSGQFEEVFRPIPNPAPAPVVEESVEPAPEPPPSPEPTLFQSGIASTYGERDGFEGNRTARGQIFHTGVVQIAHTSLLDE
jgi:rare lipoprotein A (peptidoglycan hydrolase)